jgi:hypothetical protein
MAGRANKGEGASTVEVHYIFDRLDCGTGSQLRNAERFGTYGSVTIEMRSASFNEGLNRIDHCGAMAAAKICFTRGLRHGPIQPRVQGFIGSDFSKDTLQA